MIQVVAAVPDDIVAWLALARGVESLFGAPLASDPAFRAYLEKNIARGTAICVRERPGPSGVPLAAGLLFSGQPPVYKISWLAVSPGQRRQGLGRALVQHLIHLIQPPAEVVVVTFGSDHPVLEADAGRRFYERLGFNAAEAAPNGPDGTPRQVFKRFLHASPE